MTDQTSNPWNLMAEALLAQDDARTQTTAHPEPLPEKVQWASFSVRQGGITVASGSGPYDAVQREAAHYAAVYRQDSEVRVSVWRLKSRIPYVKSVSLKPSHQLSKLGICMKTLLATTVLAAMFAMPSIGHAQSNAIHYCSGVSGGNYDFTGIAIRRQLPQHVETVNTAGSMENMAKVDKGECEAGIVQSDAYYVYMQQHPDAALTVERARDMYPEYGHLICNKSISEISDLKRGNTVLVGAAGSGSSVMWDAIVRANPKYKEVGTLPMGGNRALGKVSDGVDAQCMLFVAGLKTQIMMDANEVAKTTNGNLHLTYMRDPALFELKDTKGRPVYHRSAIPSGTYPGGLQTPGFISSGKAVDTVEVESVLIDNVPYADAHDQNISTFLSAVNKAMPSINDRVLPK